MPCILFQVFELVFTRSGATSSTILSVSFGPRLLPVGEGLEGGGGGGVDGMGRVHVTEPSSETYRIFLFLYNLFRIYVNIDYSRCNVDRAS